MISFLILSFLILSHIHLNTLISASLILCMCCLLINQHSTPYVVAGLYERPNIDHHIAGTCMGQIVVILIGCICNSLIMHCKSWSLGHTYLEYNRIMVMIWIMFTSAEFNYMDSTMIWRCPFVMVDAYLFTFHARETLSGGSWSWFCS